MVHGDVSSANILFTEVGLPLLADLGVARLLGDAAPVRTTPSYADPAVAAGGVPAPASDVFMLGAVALHALTGAPPWPGDDAAEVLELAATTGVEPDFAGRLDAAGVPDEVATIVLRALRLVPDERCTAAEFALELRHAAEPVAVELTAGRARHAARTLESWPLESVPPASAAGSSRSVRLPPFARQPLTDGVRAPTPFTRPPGEVHLARRSRLRRAAVARGGTGRARRGRRGLLAATARHRHRALRTARSVGAGRVEWGAQVAVPVRAAVARPRPPHARRPRPTDVLVALDHARSRAYARRDPALLTGSTRRRCCSRVTAALLLTTVPRGCALTGLRTTFSDVRSSRLRQPHPCPRPGRRPRRDARLPRRAERARGAGGAGCHDDRAAPNRRRLPHRGRTRRLTAADCSGSAVERPAQRRLDVGVFELEPGRGQRRGHRPLPGEHLAGELAEHEPHAERRAPATRSGGAAPVPSALA